MTQTQSRTQEGVSSYQVQVELQLESLSSPILNFSEDKDSKKPVDYWKRTKGRAIIQYTQVTGSFVSDLSRTFKIYETTYGRYGTIIQDKVIQTFDSAEPSEIRTWLRRYMQRKSDGLSQPSKAQKPKNLRSISGFEVEQCPQEPNYILRAESDRPTDIAEDEELLVELSDEPIPEDVPYRSANLLYQNESYDEPITVLANAPLPVVILQFAESMRTNKTPSTGYNHLSDSIHDYSLVEGWPDEEISRIGDRLLLLGCKSKEELDAHLALSVKYPSEPTDADYYKRKTVLDTITDQNGDFIFAPEILSQYPDWKDKFDPDLYE